MNTPTEEQRKTAHKNDIPLNLTDSVSWQIHEFATELAC